MANVLSLTSTGTHHHLLLPNNRLNRHQCVILRSNFNRKTLSIRCSDGENRQVIDSYGSSRNEEPENENALLKLARYSSELLGISASFFRPPPPPSGASGQVSDLAISGLGPLDRAQVVETIKADFARSYFVIENLTLDAYEENCEFADPAGSFKGLGRFKRNCTNFGSLVEKSDMKLLKWEDDSQDKGIGHWSFPWRPILSATGNTEYYFDPESGKVTCMIERLLHEHFLRFSQGLWLSMLSTGMFLKWLCLSRFLDPQEGFGLRREEQQLLIQKHIHDY